MGDDPFEDHRVLVRELVDFEDTVTPADRIRHLSDEVLTHYFNLLSDGRIVKNVAFLDLIERELRARNIPAVTRH